LEQGRLLTLIGPNGAGKSTLEKIIVGLYEPTYGKVEVLGENPSKALPKLMKRIGYVGENYSLYDTLTVKDNLLFFSALYSLAKEEAMEKISELLERFNAAEFIDRKVGELSRGTKQKIAICRALLFDPEVVVMDEPTAFLDPNSAETLRQTIHELNKNGKTVVYATQRLDELTRLNDTIAMLSNGSLVSIGSLSDITEKIRGVDIEVTILTKLTERQTALARKLGAKIEGNRLLFRVENLRQIPDISKELVENGLKIITISYINYNIPVT